MFIGHKTRRSTTKREEGGVSNERIPPHIDQVLIVLLEGENEEVPLQVPQILPEPQVPQMPPMPQALFFKVK